MTNIIRKSKNLILLLVLFLFAEYLRIISDYLIERSADNLVFCVIVMIWAVYLRRRILDKGTQRVLIGLAMSVVFLFVIRTCKYVLFDKNTILWYMYYIPLTMMPLMVFLMSKRISGQQKLYAHKFDWCYIAGLVLINGMILTNDLHQLVFHFEKPGDIDTYTYGVGYFITIAWIAILALLALYNLYRVCRLPQSRSKIWIPVIPVLIGVVAIIIDVLHMVPLINNTKIYQFQEIVLVMVISIVEACIRIGIIPSNDGYEEIFANSIVNACITDYSNNVIYSSDDNHIISEAAEVISAENEVIEAENKLLADEATYKTKNKLYDDIAKIVRPQVMMIEECLTNCEDEAKDFCANMAKATVLNVYIKRRINLSLIAMEQEKIQIG